MLRALRGCNENIALPAKAAANLDGAQIQAYLRHAYSERRPYHPWLSIWRYFADRQGTFLDVGANVGHTIASLAIYNTRTRIWAFEPHALCPECLAFAADLVPNGVTVFLGALGDTDGELPLYLPVVRDRKGFAPSSQRLAPPDGVRKAARHRAPGHRHAGPRFVELPRPAVRHPDPALSRGG
jgi:hypothetical protein